MDLTEAMKSLLAKGMQPQNSVNDLVPSTSMNFVASAGYVTEKLYMLIQLYLQNKGWSPSVELLQCVTELKESSMLPTGTYLQMMASRVTLDQQGRLLLRENGKIILPFEHFANAVMLKHMNGPHGLHLSLEATIRAVMDSYTIGRENFGMEREFIVEVIEGCPNPSCRYYKSHLELTQKIQQHLTAPTYLPAAPTNTEMRSNNNFSSEFSMPLPPHIGLSAMDLTGQNNLDVKGAMEQSKSVTTSQQQQLTAAIIQQQNRVIAQQNLDKLNANLEKQRQQLQLQQQLDMAAQKQKVHYEAPIMEPKLTDFLRANLDSFEASNKDLLALHNGAWSNQVLPTAQSIPEEKRNNSTSEAGQEKIVRTFAEVMKNMQRMKSCVRPAMCKPYGKQSETLQKTLMDTIQLIQSLRSCLPPPHIQVNSWKNDDKHRYEET